MKKLFKELFKSVAKGLVTSAKEEATKTLKDQIAPFINNQATTEHEVPLIKQMEALLDEMKAYMFELKFKTYLTPSFENNKSYDEGLIFLKNFSNLVMRTINEIESY
jgi:ribosomal protein S17E